MLVAAAALGVPALALSLAASGTAPATPATHEIVIEGMRYTPATLTVKAGDRVTWINRDLVAHSATARGAFDSGPIAPARSWSIARLKAGHYVVACTLHPTMTSALIVE